MGVRYNAFDRKCDRLRGQIRELAVAIERLEVHRTSAQDLAINILKLEMARAEERLGRMLQKEGVV